MFNSQLKYKISLSIFLFVFSCNKNNSTTENKTDLVGVYYELKDDNIKLFLPSYYDYLYKDLYKEHIEKQPESLEKEIELNRFNYLKFSKGNIYYLKDFASSTLITVKLLDHFKFSKKDSSQLLGIISNSCKNTAIKTGGSCEKLTAGYSGNYKTQVFKAVYKFNYSDKLTAFNTIYLVTSNQKTFSINIYSNKIENFNKYVEKIIVS